MDSHLRPGVQMAEKALTDENLEEEDACCAAKLLEIVLQNCRGRVDGCLAGYLALVLRRLPTARKKLFQARAPPLPRRRATRCYLLLFQVPPLCSSYQAHEALPGANPSLFPPRQPPHPLLPPSIPDPSRPAPGRIPLETPSAPVQLAAHHEACSTGRARPPASAVHHGKLQQGTMQTSADHPAHPPPAKVGGVPDRHADCRAHGSPALLTAAFTATACSRGSASSIH